MFTKLDAAGVIEKLGLKPLADEGGFYRETYATSGEGRPIGSAILFLVTPADFSQWHRLDCDEIFHFYFGDQLEMALVSPSGHLTAEILGPAFGKFQIVVPKGTWVGARTVKGSYGYTLIGTTCHPGYQQQGFHLPSADDLRQWIAQNPNHENLIRQLQRGIL